MQHVLPPKRRQRFLAVFFAAVLTTVLPPSSVRAHEGPPFPIVVDHDTGAMLVSVWTDPDIGTGTFFVVFEPVEGVDLPGNIRVQVGVTPQSGRLDEAVYDAEAQDVRYGARYFTEVAFDRGEWWDVRVVIESDAGTEIISSEVEATPDGALGPMSLLLFLLPFLAVGYLWLKAVLRRREASSA